MSDLPVVVSSGDRRAALVAVRDELARRLVDCDERVAASLARQLVLVLRDLDSIPSPAVESKVDDLASKRAARVARASGQ